jgi:hypothetical protein
VGRFESNIYGKMAEIYVENNKWQDIDHSDTNTLQPHITRHGDHTIGSSGSEADEWVVRDVANRIKGHEADSEERYTTYKCRNCEWTVPWAQDLTEPKAMLSLLGHASVHHPEVAKWLRMERKLNTYGYVVLP